MIQLCTSWLLSTDQCATVAVSSFKMIYIKWSCFHRNIHEQTKRPFLLSFVCFCVISCAVIIPWSQPDLSEIRAFSLMMVIVKFIIVIIIIIIKFVDYINIFIIIKSFKCVCVLVVFFPFQKCKINFLVAHACYSWEINKAYCDCFAERKSCVPY